MINKPLVIYHANCQDGFGAAYAAWKKFGDEAEYMPMQYGDWPLLFEDCGDEENKFKGREVYVLDFSFNEIQMRTLLCQTKRLVWRDHHKTAFEEWCGKHYLSSERQVYAEHEKRAGYLEAPYILLDNTKSGCILAWEYFHPDHPIPTMLKHIGDRDIWKFAIAGTKQFCEAFNSRERDFRVWDAVANSPRGYIDLITEGEILLKAQESRVASFSDPKKLKQVTLYSKTHPVTSKDTASENRVYHGLSWISVGLGTNCMSDISETGNAIAKQSGTFSLTFFVTDTEVVCSLRSIGDYDVSAIAKSYGGGGHKNASGFKMPIDRFFKEIWV